MSKIWGVLYKIDKEDLLSDKDFYKSFKNAENLTTFFKALRKKAVEHILDTELDIHLENTKLTLFNEFHI